MPQQTLTNQKLKNLRSKNYGKRRSIPQAKRTFKYLQRQREWQQVKNQVLLENNPRKWAQDTTNRLCKNNSVSLKDLENLYKFLSSQEKPQAVDLADDNEWLLACYLNEYETDEEGHQTRLTPKYCLVVSESEPYHLVVSC